MYQESVKAISMLYEIQTEEWFQIYDTLQGWKWDERLGEKPQNWDRIPRYRKNYFLQKILPEKYKYIKPITNVIEMKIGHKELLRYHHIHNLGRTEQQFQEWWENKLYVIGQRID